MGSNTLKFFVLVLINCLFLAACQNFSQVEKNYQYSPEKNTTPGKKLVVPHAEVWLLENCGSRKLPYLRLDQSEIVPKTMKSGASMRYRLSYTACVPEQSSYKLGRLETKISFKGNTQNRRSDDQYTVETGKWIVDTHIAVPKNAEPGTYVLDAALSIKGAMLQDRVSFNVER